MARSRSWQLASAVVVLLVTGGLTAVAHAQGRPGRPLRLPPEGGGVTPGEIQRMFEAMALVRAQEALKLTDERYLPFLAKYKALQEVRRKNLQERMLTLRELNRLLNESGEEAVIKEKLKALTDLDARTEADLHKAYEALDGVLDVAQQARFRLFEEMMERQKMELLMRARQGIRQPNPNREP